MEATRQAFQQLVRICKVHRLLMVLAIGLLIGASGCSSLTNPVANGIPVHRLPPELLGETKENLESIPLTALRQPPPEAYKLGPDDVLGIWIEGVLGEKGQTPPVRFSETSKVPPALGYPIPVRGDGTIALPFVPPIKVQGMTLEEAEAAIRKSYTVEHEIIKAGRERIFVTLQQPRTYHILVIRQDSGTQNQPGSGGGNIGGQATGFIINTGGTGGFGIRHGQGFAIDLPAYENDVLNALARTGGFPGTDAANEIIIERSAYKGNKGRLDYLNRLKNCPPGDPLAGLSNPGDGQIIRIPLRVRPGEQPVITPDMVTLETGDVVYIEARSGHVYYTGGLLPPGAHLLPRDVDLDILEAIVRSGGSINSGGTSSANISGSTFSQGIGSPSPSLVTILRRTQDGGQVAIRVNLNKAMRDPRERILIQPRDFILLQEDPQDAIVRYFSTAFQLNIFYRLIDSSRANVNSSLVVP